MTQFLDEDTKNRFNRIRLDYTYSKPILWGNMIKGSISSFSDDYHYKILESMVYNGLVINDMQIMNFLKNRDIFSACAYCASMGDMIFHITSNNKDDMPLNILYCPEDLGETQKIRLRLWNEFYNAVSIEYLISRQLTREEKVFYETKTQIQNYLEEQQILDDDYIRSLVKKYPDIN